MILNLFRKHHYFAVVQIDTIKEETAINPKVYKKLQNYYWWRGRKVLYMEPYTISQSYKSYVVIGTASGNQKAVIKNVMIFLMELFAHITAPDIKVSEDFKMEILNIEGTKVELYKVHK